MTDEIIERPPNRIVSLLGYALNTVVLGVASLLLIPALITTTGASTWASIAVGQALGGLAGIVVGFGWGIVGPGYVANADAEGRTARYMESVVVRAGLLLCVLPVLFLLSLVITGPDVGLAFASAIPVAAVGLAAGWYFIGRGKAFGWFFFETSFRATSTVAAAALAWSGANAYLAFAVQLVGIGTGIAVSTWWIRKIDNRSTPWHMPGQRVPALLKSQWPAVVASLVSGLYATVPLVAVSIFFPSLTPPFAILDKLQKQFATAASPVVQVLQGYVARGTSTQFPNRARRALLVAGAGALAAALLIALAGEWLISLLGAGAISVPWPAIVLTGLLIAAGIIDQVMNKAILGSLNEVRIILRATAIGSSGGVLLLLLLGAVMGVAGSVLGLALGVLLTFTISLVAYLRRSPDHETGAV